MAQPVAGYNQTRVVQGAGSTIISATPCVFHSVFIPVSAAGTVHFHDSSTVAGTSASNMIIGTLPTIQGTPIGWNFDYQLRNGLVAITSGTVNFNVSTA